MKSLLADADVQEVNDLKEKLIIIENEREEIAAALHIITIYCCNLIAQKEGKEVDDVRRKINGNMYKIMHG